MIFDIEADGLLDKATKIHVMSWTTDGEEVHSTADYAKMREVIEAAEWVGGHNIVTYDLVLMERVLGPIKFPSTIIDTLPLAWYLHPNQHGYGLDHYGKRYGVPKPKIDDWDNLTYEEYAHRCEEDVKINWRLYKDLHRKLVRLYDDESDRSRLINYMKFKMECLRDQEAFGWRLDVDKAQRHHDELQQQKEEKELQLSKAMPQRVLTAVRTPPKVMYKKDGTLSAHGERWKQLIAENYLPASTMTPITVVTGHEDGNPNSNDQVKDWLFSLGWVPKTFKYIKGENYGEERKIPQVRNDGELCDSVKDLIEVEPAIELLDGLTVINHRLGILKGFLSSHKDGWLQAGAHGITNTFRFRHRNPLVNLPGVDKPYGAEIRGCLIASEGHKLIGCDMVSLEDTTKRHYMQPLDPDYVAEMQLEGFDPHLDLAKHAGVVTQDDIDKHNAGEIDLKPIRKNYKAANYSAVYGVGAKKLARTLGIKEMQAKGILDAYWKRNWAVEEVAKSRRVRSFEGENWIYNDVSGFWHELRYDKDRWSTTNQSTGVFVFDTFVALLKRNGVRVVGQFHDEVVIDSTNPEADIKTLEQCKVLLNEKLKLNVPLDIDYEVGDNYAEIH